MHWIFLIKCQTRKREEKYGFDMIDYNYIYQSALYERLKSFSHLKAYLLL